MKKILLFLFSFSFGVQIISAETYEKFYCGDIAFPLIIAEIVSTIITILQIAVPILIIIVGSLDLMKAVMAQKEDEIKKGAQHFLKRLLFGCLIFFVVAIVKLVIGLVATDTQDESIFSCVDCFIRGKCEIISNEDDQDSDEDDQDSDEFYEAIDKELELEIIGKIDELYDKCSSLQFNAEIADLEVKIDSIRNTDIKASVQSQLDALLEECN